MFLFPILLTLCMKGVNYLLKLLINYIGKFLIAYLIYKLFKIIKKELCWFLNFTMNTFKLYFKIYLFMLYLLVNPKCFKIYQIYRFPKKVRLII